MSSGKEKVLRFVEPDDLDRAGAAFSRHEQDILDTINQRVAAGQSLPEVMDFFFETSLDVWPCDRLGLAFVEDNGQRVVSHWARALYEPLLLDKGYGEDLRGSSLSAVRKTGRLRIINDLETYLRRKPHSASTALLMREGVRSSLTCPLTVEGRNAGFLFRSSRTAFSYGDRELRLHQAVAERLSQAVEKAYRLDQLQRANRAYTEMLGFVSHELRSPLGSLVMDGKLLTEGYLGELNEKQRERLEGMLGKAQYLLGLINDYLDLARIEGGQLELNVSKVDLAGEIVEPALDMAGAAVEEKGTRVEQDLPDGAEVECDPRLITVVLVNLLSNAVKYSDNGGLVRIRARAEEQGLRLSVWNEGPGFPEGMKGRLFRRFSRLQTPELSKRKGTGVGLYTSWRIVQAHGGRIWADSREGEWAEFTFFLPQPLDNEFDWDRVAESAGGETNHE